MPDYTDHSAVIQMLQESQNAELDMTEAARDAHLFVTKRDGQWEPYLWARWEANNKPRYTFDLTTPVVNQIAGEMAKSDFNIVVRPSGGEATKDTARTLDGLIRNIENISNSSQIFSAAGRNMITCGLDGWRVKTDFADQDSFNQDLLIERVPNFIDRVWFDTNSQTQTRSDSRHGWLLHVLTQSAYAEQFPDANEGFGSPVGQSVPQGMQNNAYWRKPSDQVVIAEFFYSKEEAVDLVLMTNGTLYEVDDDFKRVVDELEAAGITEKRRRKVKRNRFYVRKMDGAAWLGEEEETVFKEIPLIPAYGNFKVFDNKIIFHGAVEKMLDSQRVLNYGWSRQIEEGALSPRAKYWMTRAQAEGHEASLQTMNTNSMPVQFYSHDDNAPPGPPQQQGGAVINEGLNMMTQGIFTMMQHQSGLFEANMGDGASAQSGVAIEKLQNKGDASTIHYTESMEIAICQTAKLLIDAIPVVYDTPRQIRMLNEDGSFEMTPLNMEVFDEETQKEITLNDLSKGQYDVTCSAGPSFRNRQDQTLSTMLEIAQYIPSTLEQGSDIIFNALDDPGADQMAERMRLQLFNQGLIPEEQMTDEEKEKKAKADEEAQNNPPPPDPMLLAAQAEQAKADAAMQAAQVKGADVEQKAAASSQKNQLAALKLQLDEQKNEMDRQMEQFEFMRESERQDLENLKIAVEAWKGMREATGADTIVGPQAIEVFAEGAEIVEEMQDRIE